MVIAYGFVHDGFHSFRACIGDKNLAIVFGPQQRQQMPDPGLVEFVKNVIKQQDGVTSRSRADN